MVTVWLRPGSPTAGHYDVPPVAGRVFGLRHVVVVACDQSLACNRVHDGLIDRVQPEQRVAGKIHLGDQTLGERSPEYREVNVRRAPGILMIPPGVVARPDGAICIWDCRTPVTTSWSA